MAKQKVEFSLLYRDMWQSSGKYHPTVSQLEEIAPVIVDMGCFSRVETNGGGFEQVQLLRGENPNECVRKWTQPFNDAGIQTHMLERGLSGIRMYPCSADLRQLFFKVKKLQGTDISRSFCGLNDIRNLEKSIKFAKAGGMISQCCMTMTYSPFHTVEYYTNLADQLIERGAEEICLKDMAGIARPAIIGAITKYIKSNYKHIKVQYHPHSGPGISAASILEAVKAGCDYIDVSMQPLSWGTAHADVLSVIALLEGQGIELPKVNMEAYLKASDITQKIMDDGIGQFISPTNRQMNPLLIGPGLPGGMMGSLMGWVEDLLKRVKKFDPDMTQNKLMVKIFDEVAEIWPMMGYPPLVTPFSQYVVVTAIGNVEDSYKGKPRFSRIDNNTWDMLSGKAGALPGPLAPEVLALAKEKEIEFLKTDPQELYPDCLEDIRKEMSELGWDVGKDEEDLFEYAMHPEQWKAFKSGKAAQNFEKELAAKKKAKAAAAAPAAPAPVEVKPTQCTVTVDGRNYSVSVVPGTDAPAAAPAAAAPAAPAAPAGNKTIGIEAIDGTLKSYAVKVGDQVKKGDVLCTIEAMKVENEIVATTDGVVASLGAKEDDDVEDGQVVISLAVS
ncbi:MAG: biotin/lipoyl-binding protein [Planctomycetes bacterium]|nr:biotin/lipoyl-binding protein [Planctomycetota bacterium]